MSEESEPFVCQVCQTRVNLGTKCWCCGSEKAAEVVTRKPKPVKPAEPGDSFKYADANELEKVIIEDDEHEWFTMFDYLTLEKERRENRKADPEDE